MLIQCSANVTQLMYEATWGRWITEHLVTTVLLKILYIHYCNEFHSISSIPTALVDLFTIDMAKALQQKQTCWVKIWCAHSSTLSLIYNIENTCTCLHEKNSTAEGNDEAIHKVSSPFSFSPPLKRLTVFPPQCCWRTSTVLEQNRFTGPHLPK